MGLHNLKPAAGSRKARKRVGRGEGSGTGKTSGRGQKGAGSRTGAKDRSASGFEGGQMPIQIRMRKLRGPNMKKSMPFEPFRTHTQTVNLGQLEERFESGAEITLEVLLEAGFGKKPGVPVKVLADGEFSKKFTVHAHKFSASAKKAIEDAGGTCVVVESK
ncbi:MAG TPA: 50S ribosomal protein L15 [Baekduia sp.]|nr:50S ribosomal protein L15 [Baekduia sp.]